MALAALAGPRTVVVAAGDCRDASLLAATRDFVSAAAGPLGSDLLEAEVVLDIVRPRPARSLQDIERQVESAKALLTAVRTPGASRSSAARWSISTPCRRRPPPGP
jgi:hypothetical protein